MITVKYECKVCNASRDVQVPARETIDQPVTDWVKSVAGHCGADHERHSPRCKSRHVDLRIPNPDNAEFVGQQIE